MEATPKVRSKRKQELSLIDEFLESDDHFQGGKYDMPIHMRDKELSLPVSHPHVDLKDQHKGDLSCEVPKKELQPLQSSANNQNYNSSSRGLALNSSEPLKSAVSENAAECLLLDQIQQSTGQLPDINQTTTGQQPDNCETIGGHKPDNYRTNTGHPTKEASVGPSNKPDINQTITGQSPLEASTNENEKETCYIPDKYQTKTRHKYDNKFNPIKESSLANPVTITPEKTSNHSHQSPKPDINQTITGHKPDINTPNTRQQQDNYKTNSEIRETTTRHKPDNNLTNYQSTTAEKNKIQERRLPGVSGFYAVTGLKRKILVEIFIAAKTYGDRTSPPIATINLVATLASSRESVERVLYRLIHDDQFISVVDSKRGRGGWVMYSISESIFTEMVRAEMNGSLYRHPGQIPDNNPTNTGPNTGQLAPSSSSFSSPLSLDSEDTNTKEAGPRTFDDLPHEWKTLDRSPLEDLGISIHNNQLLGIYRAQQNNSVVGDPLTADDVQESINMIAHDAKHKTLPKTGTPLSLLVGMLMKKNKYQVRGSNYVSPKTLAAENYVKQLMQDRKRSEEAHEQIFQAVFANWFDSLTGKQINSMTPSLKGLESKRAVLLSKFRDQFYLTIRDNPSINVNTLQLDVTDSSDISTKESDQSSNFRQEAWQTLIKINEEIRQLEAVIDSENKAEIKSELQKTLAYKSKKRQELYDQYPEIAEEHRLVESAISDRFSPSME